MYNITRQCFYYDTNPLIILTEIQYCPCINWCFFFFLVQAYVVFVQILGGAWLERNVTTLLTHVLDLVANPKAASSHVDAVYSRKCINFFLRSILGRMLGEKAQTSACKEIALLIAKQMGSIGNHPLPLCISNSS